MDVIEAIQAGDDDRVRELVAADPSRARAKDQNGVPALLLARYYGRDVAVEILRGPAEPLTIFEAAAVGEVARLAELIDGGGDVDEHAADGFTPLQLAAFFGQAEVVDVLLARGADVGTAARNPMRVQALHSAVAGPDSGVDRATVARIARALVEAGADVDARQHGGFTPLHAAAANGHEDVVRLLLDHGADPGATTDDGKTAADFAAERGHPELAGLLRVA